MVLPSPNSWSGANESNVDVDLYTGKLNYAIPLHVLKSRDLEMPITLQYSSDGVRVDDIASDVGMGWQLNAGGVIARVMRGLPDEFIGPYDIAYACSTPSEPNKICHKFIPGRGFLDPVIASKADIGYWTSGVSTHESRKTVVENSNKTGKFVGESPEAWDTEPDEFYFNFDRYSGKFVFDKNGAIQIIPHQNLLISKSATASPYSDNETGTTIITSFQVTDERGVKYTFGNVNPSTAAAMTAIDVTKYSIARKSFELGYEYDATASAVHPTKNFFNATPTILVTNLGPFTRWDETVNKQTFTSSWHLTKVESPSGDYIDLSYTNEEIKYVTGKSHDVTQLNLEEHRSGGILFYYTSEKSGDVPFLQLSNYPFFYHSQQFAISTSKSTIKSKKISSITAATNEKVTFNSTVSRTDLVGAKRVEHMNIMNHSNQWIKSYQFNYGTMSSPTEHYKYEFKIRTNDGGQGIQRRFPHEVMNSSDLGDYIFDPVPLDEGDWLAMRDADHSRLFLMGVSEVFPGISAEDIVTFEYNTNYSLPVRFSASQDYYGYFNNNAAGHTLQSIGFPDSFNATVPFQVVFASVYFDSNGNLGIRTDPLALALVDEKAKIGSLKSIIHRNGSKSTIEYSRNQALRVSSISIYPDKNASGMETTTYLYTNPIKTASINPNYLSAYPIKFYDGNPEGSFRMKITLSSAPVNQALQRTKGGLVGYARVDKVRAGIGKEIFEFRNPDAYPDTNYERYETRQSEIPLTAGANKVAQGDKFPYAPRNNFDHRRGQLKTRTLLNQDDKKLKVDSYYYDMNPTGYTPQTIYGLKPGKYEPDFGETPYYLASLYQYRTDWVYLEYTASKIYDQSDPGNESKAALTTTRYYYYRPDQSTPVPDLLARKVSTTLPNGDIIVTETKFPLDYTTTATPTDIPAKALHILKTNKMESFPVESISYLEKTVGGVTTDYLLSGQLLKFKEFQAGKVYPWQAYKMNVGTGKVFTPSTYPWSTVNSNSFTWTNNTSFKFSGSIDSYDAYGNPLTQTGEDEIQSTYTWGHNNSLLTSIVQNAGTYQHQTIYTHSPLIGVTQVTDPNSRNKNYVYDRSNRLKLETDHDNQIEMRYRYHFQNQVEGFSNTVISKSGCHMAGQPITFSSSENLEFGQTIYSWNFGNGSSQNTNSLTANYIYPSAGTFTVAVTKSNPEYQPQTIQASAVIYKPIGNVYSSVTGPTTYDVCTLTPPTQTTTMFVTFAMGGRAPADAFNVVWEYKLNSGPWNQMSVQAGPISSTSKVAPSGFGDATIVGTWTVRCTGQDACGNTYTKSFTLKNVASNPLCSIH